MPVTETSFDTSRHHIHIEIILTNPKGIEFSVDGILDTGAPGTEFSDQLLMFAGFIDAIDNETRVKHGLQTQKYNKLILPSIEICGHTINDFEIFVSRFEESWGVDALIGLDFFRKFLVTVDYSKGVLYSQPLKIQTG